MQLPSEIQAALPQLRELARSHGVRSIALIGSAASGNFDAARSDVDLLVDFGEQTEGLGRRAISFYREVQNLFRRRVDVLSVHGIRNPTWKQIHASTQVPLDAAA